VVKDFPDPWRELGEFIREQRSGARLSVRRLSDMAGISNPYLSQIERGLRKPSAEILQQIAKALQLSAETLYIRAGILDPRDFGGDVTEAVMADSELTEDQKHTLLHIYASFRRENTASSEASSQEGPPGTAGGPTGGSADASEGVASDRPSTNTAASGPGTGSTE
jgi:transcriptional regulator with XRE-family HTH domain